MKKACFANIDGELVTPTEFIRRATANYQGRKTLPYCPACGEIVHLYGVKNPHPATTQRFDHANIADDMDPLDDCVLAKRTKRFLGLEPSEWALARAQQVRHEFMEDENLARCYAFCINFCRSGNLSTTQFKSMLRRADKKNIWGYAGIEQWVIPYILLLLENFEARPQGKSAYGFHFILRKPISDSINTLWETRVPYAIEKVFSDGGKTVNTSDNPYPISRNHFFDKSNNYKWIHDKDVLKYLRPRSARFARRRTA